MSVAIKRKRCARCLETKPVERFHRNRRSKDGLWCYCKPCERARMQDRWFADAEASRARMRAYLGANREMSRAASQAWYERNRESVSARHRPYVSEWQRQNPARGRETKRRRRAQKRANAYGYLTPELIAAKEAYWGGRCWICRGPNEALDHVKPLAAGGAHLLCNLRPICAPCNRRKGARWPWPAGGSFTDSGSEACR